MRIKTRTSSVAAATAVVMLALVACSSEPQSTGPAKEPTTKGPSCEPKVGSKAPVLSSATVNTNGKIAITPGKVTLVDFWATWCAPCKKSFPAYQALYTKYKASGFELIAVAMDDDKNDIPGFIKEYGAKFPVVWDKGHVFGECWKPANMPTAYIIDKKGVVREIHNKWEDGTDKELEAKIKALL